MGFLASLSGPNAALGVDGRDGAELAVDKVNAEGGINGHPIELVIRDGLGTAAGSLAAAQGLIDDGVFVIIGHLTSSLMVSVWDATKDTGVVYLSPTTSAVQLTGIDDNFLRLTPATTTFAESLADYASTTLHLRRIAILYDTDNAAFSDAYLDGFTRVITAHGGDVIWKHGFSSAAKPDFKPTLEELRNLQPDGILIIASALDTALIAQQSRMIGCQAQLLTTNWALTADLITNGGAAVDGILTTATYNENNQTPEYQDFSRRFQARFGRMPSFSAGYGYETLLFLVEALKKTNGNQEGLKQALLGVRDFTGLYGTIALDQYGDVRRPMYLVTIHNGQFAAEAELPAP